jgi:hypothetical protein
VGAATFVATSGGGTVDATTAGAGSAFGSDGAEGEPLEGEGADGCALLAASGAVLRGAGVSSRLAALAAPPCAEPSIAATGREASVAGAALAGVGAEDSVSGGEFDASGDSAERGIAVPSTWPIATVAAGRRGGSRRADCSSRRSAAALVFVQPVA